MKMKKILATVTAMAMAICMLPSMTVKAGGGTNTTFQKDGLVYSTSDTWAVFNATNTAGDPMNNCFGDSNCVSIFNINTTVGTYTTHCERTYAICKANSNTPSEHAGTQTGETCTYCGQTLSNGQQGGGSTPSTPVVEEVKPVEPPKPVIPVFAEDNVANVSIETKNANMDKDYKYMNDFMQWSSNVTDISGNNVKTILKAEDAEKFINSVAYVDTGVAYTSETHMIYKTNTWVSFNKKSIQEMEASGYSFTIVFKYEGVKYQVEIPADAKLSELTYDADYVGFLYLMKLFGGKVIE